MCMFVCRFVKKKKKSSHLKWHDATSLGRYTVDQLCMETFQGVAPSAAAVLVQYDTIDGCSALYSVQ